MTMRRLVCSHRAAPLYRWRSFVRLLVLALGWTPPAGVSMELRPRIGESRLTVVGQLILMITQAPEEAVARRGVGAEFGEVVMASGSNRIAGPGLAVALRGADRHRAQRQRYGRDDREDQGSHSSSPSGGERWRGPELIA